MPLQAFHPGRLRVGRLAYEEEVQDAVARSWLEQGEVVVELPYERMSPVEIDRARRALQRRAMRDPRGRLAVVCRGSRLYLRWLAPDGADGRVAL